MLEPDVKCQFQIVSGAAPTDSFQLEFSTVGIFDKKTAIGFTDKEGFVITFKACATLQSQFFPSDEADDRRGGATQWIVPLPVGDNPNSAAFEGLDGPRGEQIDGGSVLLMDGMSPAEPRRTI